MKNQFNYERSLFWSDFRLSSTSLIKRLKSSDWVIRGWRKRKIKHAEFSSCVEEDGWSDQELKEKFYCKNSGLQFWEEKQLRESKIITWKSETILESYDQAEREEFQFSDERGSERERERDGNGILKKMEKWKKRKRTLKRGFVWIRKFKVHYAICSFKFQKVESLGASTSVVALGVGGKLRRCHSSWHLTPLNFSSVLRSKSRELR